jgi:hypothetical protein
LHLYEVAEIFINELNMQIENERRKVDEELKKLKTSKLFLCKDRARVYKSRPRNCENYEIITPSEYGEYLLRSALDGVLGKLRIWKWIRENRIKIPVREHFLCCSIAHFDGGYVIVFSESVTLSFTNVETLLRFKSEVDKFERTPFHVDVFVDTIDPLKPLSAREALLAATSQKPGSG